jgi:tetratricopeptide (TPR) repeat protein
MVSLGSDGGGLSLFLANRFADSLEHFQEELDQLPLDSDGVTAPEADIIAGGVSEGTRATRASLACNIAACLFELGMFRRCISLCESLLTPTELCLHTHIRAATLLSRALLSLGRAEAAAAAAADGIQRARGGDDVYAVAELARLAAGAGAGAGAGESDSEGQATTSTHSSAVVPPCTLIPPLPEAQPQAQPQETDYNAEVARKRKAEEQKKKWSKLYYLRNKYMGDGQSQVSERLARMVLKDLSHSTGDEETDLVLVLGNAQMSYGDISSAIEIFQGLLEISDRTLAAHLGIGSAMALSSCFDLAIDHFTKAIALDPTVCYMII